MRKAELIRLREEYRQLENAKSLLVPRGLVFHISPSNVDTIFVYSWLLSILCGNRNIVRLSQKRSPQTDAIVEIFNRTLENAPEVLRHNTLMLTYPHDDKTTASLSSICDVRVIWGGNNTVNTVRKAPLPPHATELTFPDRFSLSAIKSVAYQSLSDAERDTLADQFFNDAYWFDQMGCSSPRLLIWVGPSSDNSASMKDFYTRLEQVLVRRDYNTEVGTAIKKMLFAYQNAIDHLVKPFSRISNELNILPLQRLVDVRGEFCGAGFFFQFETENLLDIVPFLERRDQTLSNFGFVQEELTAFVRLANGRGIDRIVPFGQALTFNRYWDGFDLMQSLTRRVYLEPQRPIGESS
jgi:Acyl-CoA reductase (LuxC)